MQQNTLPLPTSTNGQHVPTKTKKPSKPVKPAKVRPVKTTLSTVKAWGTGYIVGSGLISCGLNALANGQHAPVHLTIPAYLLGTAIPAGCLALGKVASTLWVRNARQLAYVVGGIASVLLSLSVYHCTESIAMLTGSPIALAAGMAIAIDAGMVGCEVALTLESKGK